MIKHVSLAHGWYYHYRFHSEKTEKLCNNDYSELKAYIQRMYEDCPDEHFLKGPRSSALRFALPVKPKRDSNHEISSLCHDGLKNMDYYKTAHTKVQMFLLQFDKNTISVETPTWLLSDELKKYEELLGTCESLSGHIDVLRVEKNKVWIWDYKPRADLEKFASTQVFFYALMMSKRTGIPLKNFRCGYFDEDATHTFAPRLELLTNIIL